MNTVRHSDSLFSRDNPMNPFTLDSSAQSQDLSPIITYNHPVELEKTVSRLSNVSVSSTAPTEILNPCIFTHSANIYISDRDIDDQLTCYHYTKMNEYDKVVRGIITQKNDPELAETDNKDNKDNERIVCRTGSAIIEYDASNFEEFIDRLRNFRGDEVKVYKCEEGCQLRLWALRDKNYVKWFLSTNKKINAFDSYWGSKSTSFGSLFLSGISEYFPEIKDSSSIIDKITLLLPLTDQLDPSKIYIFTVLNSDENRIVCHSRKNNTVIYNGYYDNKPALVEDELLPIKFHLATENLLIIPYSHSVDTIKFPIKDMGLEIFDENIRKYANRVLQYTESLDKWQHPGVMIVSEYENIRLTSLEYLKYSNCRANENNIIVSYIKASTNETIDLLEELYPEKIAEFRDIDRILTAIVKNVYSVYTRRFVNNPNREMVYIVRDQYFIIKAVHALYQETGQKTTLDIIRDIIVALPSNSIIHIIDKFKQRERDHGDGNIISANSSPSSQTSAS